METEQKASVSDEDAKKDEEPGGCYIRAKGAGCALLFVLTVLAAYGLYRLILR